MKNLKKLFAILMALSMMMALAVSASADDTGTITIANASKGETYSIYKLFDATYGGQNADDEAIINYTGDIPQTLSAYFVKDDAGNIKAADGLNIDEGTAANTALRDWAISQRAVAEQEATGSSVTFEVPYGYYVVLSTQAATDEDGKGAAISVDSTTPNATMYDKNFTEPTLGKEVDDTDVYVGETVTYTVTFDTTNYDGKGAEAKKIASYKIEDTLPAFLEDVTVTSITIDGDDYKVDGATPQFDGDGKILIPWVDANENSLYANGVQVVMTYTAVVTEEATIDGAGNTNTVTLTWTDLDGEEKEPLQDEVTIYTYAAAIQKVDAETGENLPGATFSIAGISVDKKADGYYMVVAKGENLNSGELTCDSEGLLVIEGLDSEASLTVTEEKAPDGYNKLADPVTLVPHKVSEEVITSYTDEEGVTTVTTNYTEFELEDGTVTYLEVENVAGIELPETGGIGTTIFTVGGAALMIGAAVLFITKKRVVG